MSETFVDNSAQGRFELTESGHLTYASYKIVDGKMLIPYVEAAIPLRGTGAAGRLMTQVAAAAPAKNVKVVPLCGYAAMWFRRHPEHKDLLD